MKIAIWLDPDFKPQSGGSFSYYDRLVKAVDDYSFDSVLDICFVTTGTTELPFKREVVRLRADIHPSRKERIMGSCPKFIGRYYRQKTEERLTALKWHTYRKQLEDNGVKLIFYPMWGRDIPNFPFVATNWDIGHLSTFAFPELCMNGTFEERNKFYTEILPQALLVFCESEAGKEELVQFTHIRGDKIKVVPLFAGNCIEEQVSEVRQDAILQQYGLEKNHFFFYPAQFWAHKNHFTLLNAFKKYCSKYPDTKLVLTGSDHGNLAYIKTLINEYGLEEKIVFPGFVPNDVIYTFYKNAISLIMASFFGPTNMPPLEAMTLGCPVIASDLSGHREQLGDAALYFSASKADELVACMEEMSAHHDDYRKKIETQQLKSIFTLQEALSRINKYLVEAATIRSAWA